MSQLTSFYCGLWGFPGCVTQSTFEAVRLVFGTFALTCVIVWAYALARSRG